MRSASWSALPVPFSPTAFAAKVAACGAWSNICATAHAWPAARAAATAAGAPSSVASRAAAWAANAAVRHSVIGRSPRSHARRAAIAARGRSSPGRCASKMGRARSAQLAAQSAIAWWIGGSGLAHFAFCFSPTPRSSQQSAPQRSACGRSCRRRVRVGKGVDHKRSFLGVSGAIDRYSAPEFPEVSGTGTFGPQFRASQADGCDLRRTKTKALLTTRSGRA